MTFMSRAPEPVTAAAQGATPVYDAHDLITDGVKAEIVLDGQTYILRITRAGKLILTK
ncbi:hemin uptake protein HemP [Ponticoccus litoralis]|uniref:Hemin uptake protein HemP n=1 Tax=Ponticoccus litoralis TaxID=422297 RepID=A0AAW9SEH9_9RHOB